MIKHNIDSILDSNSILTEIERVITNDQDNITNTETEAETAEVEAGIVTEGPYIADSSYNIEAAIDVSSLDEDDIQTIADAFYQVTLQSSSSTTSSSSSSTSSSTSDFVYSQTASEIGTSVTNSINTIVNALGSFGSWVNDSLNTFSDVLSTFSEYLEDDTTLTDSGFGSTLTSILQVISDQLTDYQDGVSETSFGSNQEESWVGSTTSSFLNYFQQQNQSVADESSRQVNILASNPLDPGDVRGSLYGSMMLGAPFLFNRNTDPNNRSLINTLIRDGKFVSLTPGLPKYNGTSYTASSADSILKQTSTPTSMLEYLTKNGLDADFSNKDKRYYTFQTNYGLYFAYLETMLNVIWIKMGLAKNGDSVNIFSFFDIKDSNSKGGIAPSNYEILLEQFNSSIGFFTNPASAVSESVDNQTTSFGSEMASRVNEASDDYQKVNYITGMGTGSSTQNALRKVGNVIKSASQFKSLISSTFGETSSAISSFDSSSIVKTVSSVVKVVAGLATDISSFATTNDLGNVIQTFATTNGMKVVYPELWSDASYSRNINLNFTFTSPYGDPLSIFKYVYVPFCALACFAFPRQAAENGYVSPFFVRADIPGVFTSDMALITSFTWTKGGSTALFTKDGLPRTIDVSITITDLYPYLSMSKRISYLSANPSYAVFLDNMSGMLALNDTGEEDGLNAYFKEMLDRVNGESIRNGNNLWNRFNTYKSELVKSMSESVRESLSATVDIHSIPWMHNSST